MVWTREELGLGSDFLDPKYGKFELEWSRNTLRCRKWDGTSLGKNIWDPKSPDFLKKWAMEGYASTSASAAGGSASAPVDASALASASGVTAAVVMDDVAHSLDGEASSVALPETAEPVVDDLSHAALAPASPVAMPTASLRRGDETPPAASAPDAAPATTWDTQSVAQPFKSVSRRPDLALGRPERRVRARGVGPGRVLPKVC